MDAMLQTEAFTTEWSPVNRQGLNSQNSIFSPDSGRQVILDRTESYENLEYSPDNISALGSGLSFSLFVPHP